VDVGREHHLDLRTGDLGFCQREFGAGSDRPFPALIIRRAKCGADHIAADLSSLVSAAC
jgi:hypothetical protein